MRARPSTWAVAVGEAALALGIVAFHVVDHRRVPDHWHAVTHPLAGVSTVALAAALGADLDDLGLAPARLARGAGAGLVAGAVTAGAVAALARLPRVDEVFDDPRVRGIDRPELLRRVLVDIPVGTAVYEELVFRSAVLGLARRRVGDARALAFSSAVFGLWHILPAIEDRGHNEVAGRYPLVATVGPTVVATTVAGVLFGRLRLRSGSVAAPIVAHAAANVAGLLAARAVSGRRRTDGTDSAAGSDGAVR